MNIILAGILVMLLLWFCLVSRYERQRAETLYGIQQKGSVLPKSFLCAGLWLYDRKCGIAERMGRGRGGGAGNRQTLFDKYQAVHMGDWSREAYELSQVRRWFFAWLALAASCTVACAVGNNIDDSLYNEDGMESLQRPEEWRDTQTYHLMIEGQCIDGEIKVQVPGQAVPALGDVLESAAACLPELILGENRSLEQVFFDMELPTELDGGIQVAWDSSRPEIISKRGRVYNQELEPEGIMAELTGVLTYGEASLVTVIPVRVYPPMKDSQYYISRLEEELEKAGWENREEPYVVLPEEIEGVEVRYEGRRDNRPWLVLLAGMVGAVCIVLLHRQEIEEGYRERNRQLQGEYSKIVSELAMLLHCGLPVRVCWQRMVAEYGQELEADRNRFSYALEEMGLTYRQIMGGMPEAGAYLSFGNRCGLYEYRRLGMLLEQTVRQGSKGLMALLENEAVWAMEQRKNLAKKRGEEAGTKMMLPMFMMFGVVVAVVMVPALMSF